MADEERNKSETDEDSCADAVRRAEAEAAAKAALTRIAARGDIPVEEWEARLAADFAKLPSDREFLKETMESETERPIAKHITEAEHDRLIDEEARKGFPKLGMAYAIRDKCNMQTIRDALISAESILRYTPDFTTNVRGTRPMTTTKKSLEMVRAALATITAPDTDNG